MNKYLRWFFCVYHSELSNGSKENTGAGRGHSVEANPKEVGFPKKLKISYIVQSGFTHARRLHFVYIQNKMGLLRVRHVTVICLRS